MSRTSNRQDYDFGPFEDDYRGFTPGDGEGARGPLILALAGGILLIFGAVIWNTYKQGIRPEAGALPVVYADASPYKRALDNPGGVTTPDQERRIYDQLDGSDRTPAETSPQGPDDVLQGGPPIDLRPGEESDIDEETGIPRAALPQVAALEDLENLPNEAGETSQPKPATPVAEPTLDLPSARFKFDESGAYLVQIAALRTQEAADAAWGAAIDTHPSMYNGAQKHIQRADLGAKGVFYRLRVGAFPERADASAFCNALKDKGQSCLVVSG